MTIQTTIATGHRQENWLIELGFATPVFLTDSDIPIVYDGDRYEPADIRTVSVPLQTSGGPCKVVLNDDGTLDALEIDEDSAGLDLVVSRIYDLDTSLVALEWSGIIEDWQVIDRQRVSISGAPWGLLKTGPALPLLTDVCVHEFKGTGCGYSGASVNCNGSLGDCRTRSNEARFVSAYCAPVVGSVVWISGLRYVMPSGGGSAPNSAPGGSVGPTTTTGESVNLPPAPTS